MTEQEIRAEAADLLDRLSRKVAALAQVGQERCDHPAHQPTHRRGWQHGYDNAQAASVGSAVAYARTNATDCGELSYRQGIAHGVALRIRDRAADMMDRLAALPHPSQDSVDLIDRLDQLRQDADRTAAQWPKP